MFPEGTNEDQGSHIPHNLDWTLHSETEWAFYSTSKRPKS